MFFVLVILIKGNTTEVRVKKATAPNRSNEERATKAMAISNSSLICDIQQNGELKTYHFDVQWLINDDSNGR